MVTLQAGQYLSHTIISGGVEAQGIPPPPPPPPPAGSEEVVGHSLESSLPTRLLFGVVIGGILQRETEHTSVLGSSSSGDGPHRTGEYNTDSDGPNYVLVLPITHLQCI